MKKGLKLIDNSSQEYQLGEVLRELFKDNSYSSVAIATGYWDLPGMVEIYDELEAFLQRENTTFRLLLGEEPSVRTYQVKNPQKVDPDFPEKYLKKDLEDLQLKEEFQKVASLLEKHLDNENKIQIRVYRQNFLHAKCYIFGNEEENAVGIIGSSNFTKNGLFGNLELNQFEDNGATVNFIRKNLTQHPTHRSWFEDLWKESEEWNRIFKEEVLALSKHGGICYSPYEMYIHALYRIYGQDLQDEKEKLVSENEEGKPQLLKFQIQNANSLVKKLERQNIAMLSDSVGLGKTYTAIKVIEYYKKVKGQRVVLITPAGLKEQWRTAFADFGIIHDEIYSLQDTARIEDVRKSNLKSIEVGLFVFDESHNLRTSNGDRFKVFTDWRLLSERSKTLLLTATPINNQLSDLTTQITLGTGGDIKKLGVFLDRASGKFITIKERLENLHKDIRLQRSLGQEINYTEIKEQLTPLLNKFIVRRTRQGIEKEYPDGLEINGKLQKFPKSIPDNLLYDISKKDKTALLNFSQKYAPLTDACKYTIETLAELDYLAHPLDLFEYCQEREEPIEHCTEILYTGILALGFPCYRYNIYRHAFYRRRRGDEELRGNDDLSRQTGLYGIFRTIYLKRMESSLNSILISLQKYEVKLTNFKKKLEKTGKIISIKNLVKLDKFILNANPNSAEPGENDEDINIEEFENSEDGELTIDADEGIFNVTQLKSDIDKDLAIVSVLKEQLGLLIKKDDKIQVLAKHLNQNNENKVLVFTYFADTLKYLEAELPKYLVKEKNIEFALGTKNEIEKYAGKFSPLSKKYTFDPGEKEIDFLVATDKLSEGQNLQDCGMIVNYDLHWNPVRMIQRNGRINRLGSKHEEIFVYNFRPTLHLESYLNLLRKLQAKIDLIRYTIGTDQSVLDEEPVPQDYTEDLYSKDEKKRQEAFKRIFETSELLAAEDFFMDDLRAFDRNENFDNGYKSKIKKLPKGKWGKAPNRKEDDNYVHLAHITDDKTEEEREKEKIRDSGSYFVLFDQIQSAEMISNTEGLLHIRASGDNNQRFRDVFRNKPETEEMVKNYIANFQFDVRGHMNEYNIRSHQEAIANLTSRMIEFGEQMEEIEKVRNLIFFCQNSYINKQTQRLIKDLVRLERDNRPVGSKEIEKFKDHAKLFKPDEIIEKAPLSEVVQIFVR